MKILSGNNELSNVTQDFHKNMLQNFTFQFANYHYPNDLRKLRDSLKRKQLRKNYNKLVDLNRFVNNLFNINNIGVAKF